MGRSVVFITSVRSSGFVGKRQPPPSSDSDAQYASAPGHMYTSSASPCCQVRPQHDEPTVPLPLSVSVGAAQVVSFAQTLHASSGLVAPTHLSCTALVAPPVPPVPMAPPLASPAPPAPLSP